MRSEKELKEKHDRIQMIWARLQAFTEKNKTNIPAIIQHRMRDVLMNVHAGNVMLNWVRNDRVITEEEVGEGYITLETWLMKAEEFIDQLYERLG